jgi:streptogramin lyase
MRRYLRYLTDLIHRSPLAWLAVVVLLLAACGSSATTRASATPSPTVLPTATAVALPSLTLTTVPLGIQGAVSSITEGVDGNLWFTSYDHTPPLSNPATASTVGRVTMYPFGVVTTIPLPNPSSAPSNIIFGPDHTLWFTEPGSNAIGRITIGAVATKASGAISPTGVVTEYALPTLSGQTSTELFGIFQGSDGTLWFTWRQEGPSLDQANIGRITSAGVITAFPLSPPYDRVGGIILAADGNMWYTVGAECSGSGSCHRPAIGRISPSGVVTTFAFSDTNPSPAHIMLGTDGKLGNLWFDGPYGNAGMSMIGRITEEQGESRVFPLPCSSPGVCLQANSLMIGPGFTMWFAGGPTTIGRSTLDGAITQYHASMPGPIGPLSLEPDHNLWVGGGDAVARVEGV